MSEIRMLDLNLRGEKKIWGMKGQDIRGEFSKRYEKNFYEKNGISFNTDELFYSKSHKNVIRGLHFQTHKPQAKIVSVVSGSVWDVIVDLRNDSTTYGKWESITLSGDNKISLYIPKGFAHGFLATEDNTIMIYQCEGEYLSHCDSGIRFDDPILGILWPVDISEAVMSERDKKFMYFEEFAKCGYSFLEQK